MNNGKAGKNAAELHAMLKPLQEKRGYFFNCDMGMTMALLDELLANKDRYGYMACPCRLANGVYEADKDILCPCVYRQPDVRDYGTCYCGLYVSAARKDDPNGGKRAIPDRRNPGNIRTMRED